MLKRLVYLLSMGTLCVPKVRPPTPVEIATQQLTAAQFELLDARLQMEEKTSKVDMLEKRIIRLQSDIKDLIHSPQPNFGGTE